MKVKAALITLALSLAAASVVIAKTDSRMGTWKLNEAKSKIAAGAPKNHTVIYEAAGDDVKVTVDGSDADGNALHNEWTGRFNGKCYAITGSPTADQRCYRTINSRTLQFTERKDNAIVVRGTVAFSKNGKTRTVTTSSTDAKGKRFTSVAVYDRE